MRGTIDICPCALKRRERPNGPNASLDRTNGIGEFEASVPKVNLMEGGINLTCRFLALTLLSHVRDFSVITCSYEFRIELGSCNHLSAIVNEWRGAKLE
jgi:hypothetical protein